MNCSSELFGLRKLASNAKNCSTKNLNVFQIFLGRKHESRIEYQAKNICYHKYQLIVMQKTRVFANSVLREKLSL